jgi:predicted amidohydrolase YtcJ
MDHEADLILRGGTIFTVVPARPRARAVAIAGGRIVAVGDEAEVLRARGPHTRVVELGGRAVLPALTDGHAHLYGLGRALDQVDLRGCPSAEACADQVAAAARERPAGEWLLGRGWDQNRFADGRFPNHAVLDKVVGGSPVWMRRVDGHAGWANARALAAGGVTAHTADPPGGRIERDSSGAPTGVLVDNAMQLVEHAIPPVTAAARERTILAAQSYVLARGLTEVHEMDIDAATVEVYRQLAAAGRLQLRVYAFADGADDAAVERLLAGAPDRSAPEARFTLRGIKLYADGALGSRGAALLAPYSDEPKNSGLMVTPPERMERIARRALAAGWQMAIHAIGDRANKLVLDAYEHAGCRGRDHRFRVEHAQVLALDDVPRFAALGVVASMQPTHATSDMPWAEARLGAARLAGAYAWRRLLDAGASLVGGSDFPVEKVEPIGGGLYAAVTRMDPAGQPPGGWLPDQRLSLDEAVRAFTAEAAWAAFEEAWRGHAAPGQVADLTVLDRDLPDAAALLKAEVDLTIVGGRIVYERQR